MMTMAAPTYGTTTMAYGNAMSAPTMAYGTTTMAAAPAYAYEQPAFNYAQTVAAPQVTFAAAPMTTQVASYVAPSVMMMAQPQTMGISVPQVPMAPVKLTQGIPTPEQILQQKSGYSAALDKQLKEAIDTVQKETAIEKEMIKFTAEKTIALHSMQVDEKLIEAMALADEQATFALCELNKAKVERSIQLSNQANGLVMDYQMKAIQTELAQKQYQFQVTYVQAENKLAQDYNRQVVAANTGTTYAVPAAAVPAAVAPAAPKK